MLFEVTVRLISCCKSQKLYQQNTLKSLETSKNRALNNVFKMKTIKRGTISLWANFEIVMKLEFLIGK